MIKLALFIISVVLFVVCLPIALIHYTIKNVAHLLFLVAVSIDMAGNVLLQDILNDYFQSGGYKFGNRKETISSALGKNKLRGTLTPLGKELANTLDWIDPNHCIKSIDNNV